MIFVVWTVSKTTSEGVTKMQINRQVQGKLSEENEEKDRLMIIQSQSGMLKIHITFKYSIKQEKS